MIFINYSFKSERCFLKNGPINIRKKEPIKWPWSDLVVYFNKFVKLKKSNILELGCGMGANINLLSH